MRAELDGLPEIVHGDMFRVQGKPEGLSAGRSTASTGWRRCAAGEDPELPTCSPRPSRSTASTRWNLVQLPLQRQPDLYLNALVYHKQYAMSEIEAGFVQFVRDHKASV